MKILFFTLTLCGLINLGGNIAVAQVKNAHPGAGNISVAGDSLAAGMGATDYAVTPSGCLGGRLAAPVQNISLVGSTSADLEAHVSDLEKNNSKLIFISSGGNDAILTTYGVLDIPAVDTLDNMGRIFDDLLSTGALVVYLGLNPPLKGAERLPLIADLARAKGVLVIDGMMGFWNDTSLMHDIFHPNQAGYTILCDRIIDAVQPYYP